MINIVFFVRFEDMYCMDFVENALFGRYGVICQQ